MDEALWTMGFVGAAFTGLAVLAWSAFRLATAVDRLGHELRRTGRRLEGEQSPLTNERLALQTRGGQGVGSQDVVSS